jgi:heme-degrading monooxygenase HmoA
VVTFGLDYDVVPGRERQFERLAAGVVQALAGVPGHRRSRLYRDVLRPGSYLVRSEWESAGALRAFTHSPAFAQVLAVGPELLLGPPAHRLYREDDGSAGDP